MRVEDDEGGRGEEDETDGEDLKEQTTLAPEDTHRVLTCTQARVGGPGV